MQPCERYLDGWDGGRGVGGGAGSDRVRTIEVLLGGSGGWGMVEEWQGERGRVVEVPALFCC